MSEATRSRAARPPKPITPAYLEKAALAYLERFASSAENLRRVLWRKVERSCRRRDEDPARFAGLVDELVRRFVASGLVDDRRYAEGRIASLRRRGGSARLITAKLRAKGVDRELIEAGLTGDKDDERAAAEAFAQRRRIGPYRTGERGAFREKDLAAFARAGFGYEVARGIVDRQGEDA